MSDVTVNGFEDEPTIGSQEAPPEGVGNSANDKQRKKRLTKQELRDREDREFFHLVMASEAGRRFLWAILSDCHTFETRFGLGPTGFPDSYATWFQAGRQEVGQEFYRTLHLRDPANTMLMLNENDPRFQKVEA